MNTVLYFYRWNGRYMECAEKSGRIAVPYTALEEDWEENREDFLKLRQAGVKIFAALPSAGTGYHDEKIRKWIGALGEKALLKIDNKAGEKAILAKQQERLYENVAAFFPDGIYIGNQGQFEMLRGLPVEIFGDEGLNVFNRYSLDFWRELGLSGNVLSYELEESDAKALLCERDLMKSKVFAEGFAEKAEATTGAVGFVEVLVYGRVPVMVSEYCPIAGALGEEQKHCGACKGKKGVVLVSERGERYPVLVDNRSCQTMLLSAKPVDRRGCFAGHPKGEAWGVKDGFARDQDKIAGGQEDFVRDQEDFVKDQEDFVKDQNNFIRDDGFRSFGFSSKGKLQTPCLYRFCVFDESTAKLMEMLNEIQL